MNEDLEELKRRIRNSANVRQGWIERKAVGEKRKGHCVCPHPEPTKEGRVWVQVYGTVECAKCGRAIFTATGEAVHS